MKRIVNFLLVMAILAGVTACSGPIGTQSEPPRSTWQEQYDLGVRYLEEGNYEEAIIAFTVAIEIDPKQALAYVGRGGTYVASGETEENLAAAQADYEIAIELDETNADAYLGLADVYIRKGEFDKALEILQQGIEKTENSEEIADKIKKIKNGTINDSNGRVRRQNYFDPNGNLEKYYIMSYFDYGEKKIWYNADNSIYLVYDIQETNGQKRETIYDANNAVLATHIYLYRDDGIEIGYENYSSDGTLAERREYTFNADGKQNGFIDYASDGQVIQHQEETTDDQGNTITSFYNPDGSLREYYVPILDEAGQSIGWTQFSADGTILGTSYVE